MYRSMPSIKCVIGSFAVVTFQFSPVQYLVGEAGASVSLEVVKINRTTEAFTVNFATVDVTANGMHVQVSVGHYNMYYTFLMRIHFLGPVVSTIIKL